MNRHRLIVLTGAGISAESGLKTFRDSDGLWMGYNIEDVATPGAFQKDPNLVLDFYNMRRRDVAAASPNAAHIGIAELEQWYDVTVITQNIDDLHERGGSSKVLHLHGEIFKMCSCYDKKTTFEIREDMHPGKLAADGSPLRPAIVWFEEEVPMIPVAARHMIEADIFILVGTSLQVYPAAGLTDYLRPGIPKYIIDKKIPPVPYMLNMTLIEKPATDGVREVVELLKKYRD